MVRYGDLDKKGCTFKPDLSKPKVRDGIYMYTLTHPPTLKLDLTFLKFLEVFVVESFSKRQSRALIARYSVDHYCHIHA